MQTVSSNFLAAAKASSTPVFHAYLYRDGNLLYELPLADGEVSYDLNSDVQGEASLVVMDASGTMSPTEMASDLTPFGAEINITAGFKLGNTEEVVSLGWFVIQDMEIDDSFSWYYQEKRSVDAPDIRRILVPRGSRFNLKLRDRTQKLVDYKFLAPERTKMWAVWDEIVRLIKNVVPVTDPGYVETEIGVDYNYGDDRYEAIKGLAAIYAAEPVMLPNGNMTLRLIDTPKLPSNTAPDIDWKVNLTGFKKSLSREDVYNIVVARGTDTAGKDIVAYSTVTSGPTAWNGSFGPRPIFYNDTKITNRTALKAFADAKLATLAQANAQTMPVTALPNYAVEVGDYVTFVPPETDPNFGEPYEVTYFECRIVKLKHSANGEMQAELAMPKEWMF